MSFAERQKQWDGRLRAFRQFNGRGDRPVVWDIWVEGDRYFTRHGLFGGQMQETSKKGKVKNKGRSNEVSAETDAMEEAKRLCTKKSSFEGYDEWDSAHDCCYPSETAVQTGVVEMLRDLPSSFCLYKPENNLYDQKALLAAANQGQVWYTLKKDGLAMWVVVDGDQEVHMYSRRSRRTHDKEPGIPWTARFPHLVASIKKLKLAPWSLLGVELVMPQADNFRLVSSYTKSFTEQALADMAIHGLPALYWWELAFHDGKDLLAEKPYAARQQLMASYLHASPEALDHIQPVSIVTFDNPDAANAFARAHKLEGWVVVDPTKIYGDKGWNIKGKPDRPSSCAKLKPKSEDDFVAYWNPNSGIGEWGKGRHEWQKMVTLPNGQVVEHGGVGSVALHQFNSKGELVYCADCSSGMSYEFQAQLRGEHFPMVVQVEFTERTYMSDGEKTNALRFPVFLRVRDDKKPEECVNDRL